MTVNIYNQDCMIAMSGMKDKEYDLAICDPPYGIGQPKQGNLKGYNGRPSLEERLLKNRLNCCAGKLKDRVLNQSNCEWDNKIPDEGYFVELFRITKNQIIWGMNYFVLPATRGVICWDKVQPWENFSQIELAWTSFDYPAKLFRYDNRTGGKIHPTQKPVALYQWLLKNYAKQGDRILDTHGGSCSSAIACDIMGFDADIFEIDKDYYEAALDRFNRHKQQQVINFGG